tara:strand:+ start:406 stop:915 length:510 start_codon:yes stop_codon:yes gene_type:complete
MQLYRKTDIMKNYLLLIALFLTFNYLHSQSNRYIAEYQSDGIYVGLLNNQGKELKKVLFGKDVSISFDDFYKELEIKFQNTEGDINAMKLFSIGEDESELGKYLIMKDVLENTYHVRGDIEKQGTLVIFFNKSSESGNKMYLTIQGAKRVYSNKMHESDIALSHISRVN